jgi:hypothetical protein
MANAPFWQLAILQSIGPLITVLIGTLAIGFLASRITARAQQRREDQQLRHNLIVEMAEAASALYLATQRYWRARDRDKATADQLQTLRTWLDERYHEVRVRGQALETRLGVAVQFRDAKRHWHATMDLLTVRYFQLTDPDNNAALDRNAGEEHSGLSSAELRNPQIVLDAYHKRLDQAVNAVRTELLAPEQDRQKHPVKAIFSRLKLTPSGGRIGKRRANLGSRRSPA